MAECFDDFDFDMNELGKVNKNYNNLIHHQGTFEKQRP